MDETENECRRQCDDPTVSVGKSPAAAGTGRFQFTLSELLTVVTCGSVGLAGARWLPGGWFALALGFLAFSGIVFVGVCKAPRIVQLAACALLATYILAAAATVALNWTGREEPSPCRIGPVRRVILRRVPCLPSQRSETASMPTTSEGMAPGARRRKLSDINRQCHSFLTPFPLRFAESTRTAATPPRP